MVWSPLKGATKGAVVALRLPAAAADRWSTGAGDGGNDLGDRVLGECGGLGMAGRGLSLPLLNEAGLLAESDTEL